MNLDAEGDAARVAKMVAVTKVKNKVNQIKFESLYSAFGSYFRMALAMA